MAGTVQSSPAMMTGETGEIAMIVCTTLTAGAMIGVVTAMMETEGIVVIATGAEIVLRFVPSCPFVCLPCAVCAVQNEITTKYKYCFHFVRV